jgi:hypothetical protein
MIFPYLISFRYSAKASTHGCSRHVTVDLSVISVSWKRHAGRPSVLPLWQSVAIAGVESANTRPITQLSETWYPIRQDNVSHSPILAALTARIVLRPRCARRANRRRPVNVFVNRSDPPPSEGASFHITRFSTPAFSPMSRSKRATRSPLRWNCATYPASAIR